MPVTAAASIVLPAITDCCQSVARTPYAPLLSTLLPRTRMLRCRGRGESADAT